MMKGVCFKICSKYAQKTPTRSNFTLVFITFVTIITSHSLITVSSASELDDNDLISDSESFVKVKKCCPLNEYFNVAQGICQPWPRSNGTRWTFVDREVLTNDTITREWEPPAKFYSWFSKHYQPILRFNSNSIGNPQCWNGKSENIRTDVVKLPKEEEWNKNVNVTWDWENEINYFFTPGSPHLIEVTPREPYKETYHNPDHFCVDLTMTELILRICGCSDQQPCIRKCCPSGQHLSISTDEEEDLQICVDDDDLSDDLSDHWEIPLHSKPHVLLSKEERQRLKPRYVVNQLSCTSMSMTSGWSMTNIEHGTFIIYQNGSPQYYDPKKQTWSFLTTGSDHCFDRLNGNSSNEICPGEPEIMLFCLSEHSEEPQSNDTFYKFYVVALVIATILLLLTAIVVSLLIEKKNIHSWTRLAYVLSHFIFFLLVGLTHVHAVTPTDKTACFIMAVLIHWTGLATACWLSVINFDLWWTFKVLKPRRGHKLDIQRFLWYILFAFGLPTMIVAIALGIQSQEPKFICRSSSHIKRPIAPHYADDRRCTMSEAGRPAYWFGPLVILLVANLIFFCTTTCRMVGLQRMTRRASIESTSGQTQSRQIFIKIFIVSGVTWWIEIIQWLFSHDPHAWYELLLDMIHFVQAFAIFVIFVCKRDVIRNLQIKYPVITKVIPPVSRLERSGTIGSMSTEPNSSRSFRIVKKVYGRKMSTTSTTSSTAAGSESYRRQESYELPASSDPSSKAPTTISNSNFTSVALNPSSFSLSVTSSSSPVSSNPIPIPIPSKVGSPGTKSITKKVSIQEEGQVHVQGQGQGQYFHRRETMDVGVGTIARLESIDLDDPKNG